MACPRPCVGTSSATAKASAIGTPVARDRRRARLIHTSGRIGVQGTSGGGPAYALAIARSSADRVAVAETFYKSGPIIDGPVARVKTVLDARRAMHVNCC